VPDPGYGVANGEVPGERRMSTRFTFHPLLVSIICTSIRTTSLRGEVFVEFGWRRVDRGRQPHWMHGQPLAG